MTGKKYRAETQEEETNYTTSKDIENNNDKKDYIKKTITISLNKFLLICFIIVILICITLGLCIYEKNIKSGDIEILNSLKHEEITDEYLTENFKKNGFEEFDLVSVKILTIEDINYNNFNKLVMAKLKVQSNNVSLNLTSLLLVNRKEDLVDSFEINSNIVYLFNGISKEYPNSISEITKICAKYIQDNGTKFLNDNESDEFKNIVKEISNIIGIEKSREIVIDEYKQYTSNINMNYTLLFDKNSSLVKYMAFLETVTKYNPNYPMDENMYNYLASSYSNRQSLNAIQYVYGPPYISVTQYSVIPVKKNSEPIGSYSSLEDIIKDLNVEVFGIQLNANSNGENEEKSNDSNTSDNDDETDTSLNDANTTQKDDNYSNSESANLNNEENNYNNTEIIEKEPTISLEDIDVENLSFAEIKSEIERRGLKVKKEEETKTISVFDYPKKSEYRIIGYKLKKGDTVTVLEINYITEGVEMSFQPPVEPEHYLNSEKTEHGVKVYFNDQLVYAGDSEFTYTFKKNENINIKVIAPYTNDSSNVTIMDRTITLKELYEKWSSGLYAINKTMLLSFLE